MVLGKLHFLKPDIAFVVFLLLTSCPTYNDVAKVIFSMGTAFQMFLNEKSDIFHNVGHL